MAFKMRLTEVVKQLRKAVGAHGKQADAIEGHIEDMKKGSSMKKIDPMYDGKPGVQQSDFKQFKK